MFHNHEIMNAKRTCTYSVFMVCIFFARVSCKWEDDFSAAEMDCPDPSSEFLTKTYVPYGAPNRAIEMLPKEVALRKSKIPEAGFGVVSLTFIKKNTWLDEYLGEFLPLERKNQVSPYAYQIKRNRVLTHFVDAYPIDTSSWVRFINCARFPEEENVMTLECKGRIFLVTNRDIHPGEELMFYYGDPYEEDLGIDVSLFSQC